MSLFISSACCLHPCICRFEDDIRSCFALLIAFAVLGVVLNGVSFANVNLVP